MWSAVEHALVPGNGYERQHTRINHELGEIRAYNRRLCRCRRRRAGAGNGIGSGPVAHNAATCIFNQLQ
jgi:hypothetical protein